MNKEYLIKAELPEMKKEDVRLTVEKGCPRYFRGAETPEGSHGAKTSSDRTGVRQFHAQLLASGGRGWEHGGCGLPRRDAHCASSAIGEIETEIDRDQDFVGLG